MAAGARSGVAKNAMICSVKVIEEYSQDNYQIFTDGLQRIGEVAVPGKSVILLAEGVYTGDNDHNYKEDQARIRSHNKLVGAKRSYYHDWSYTRPISKCQRFITC